MGQKDSSCVHATRVLAGLMLLVISGISHAATITLNFSGDLDTVTAASTAGYGAANPAYFVGTTAYSGVIEYDSDTGAIVNGSLTFASGYTMNNYFDFVPDLARIERSWGAVTYELTGSMVTTGGSVSLLIGNELVPGTDLAGDPIVQAVASSSLAQAISGDAPTCTAFLPERQTHNCFNAPGEEILGLDSLSLQMSTLTNTHTLTMDEVIDHCGGDCSTEWWHMSGGGVATLAAVPVPAAVWLFGSALGMLGWVRRKAA